MDSNHNMQALIDFVSERDGYRLDLVTRPADEKDVPFAVVPKDKRLVSLKPILDEYLLRPERKRGTAALEDVDSFIAHVNRFKGEHTVIFGVSNRTAPSFTAVFDYNEPGAAGLPDWGKHRAVLRPALDDAWKFWTGIAGAAKSQTEFADIMEDRVSDIGAAPPPESPAGQFGVKLGARFASLPQLQDLAKGLKINENSVVKEIVNRQSGTVQLQFETEHVNDQGAPIDVPKLFCINIPVFLRDAFYEIAVQLRYRRVEKRLVWIMTPMRPDVFFDHAFKILVERVRAETDLPFVFGAPEFPA